MKKLTTEEYLKIVYNDVLDEYTVLEEYVDTKTKILMRHNVCGNEWRISPNKFIMGRRCPSCQNERIRRESIKTIERVKDEVLNISNGNIFIFGGNYKNGKSKMLFFCNICKKEFEQKITDFINQNRSCPYCNKNKKKKPIKKIVPSPLRKTQKQFEDDVFKIYKNEYVVLGKYTRAIDHILIRHSNCGNEWMVTPSNLLRGYGCPKCNMSKGERRISEWLNKNNYFYEVQKTFSDCRDKNLLKFDFYIEKSNILIEYDGELHYKTHRFVSKEKAKNKLSDSKKKDLIKDNYAKNRNILLLRIPYWDFEKIEEILMNVLVFNHIT